MTVDCSLSYYVVCGRFKRQSILDQTDTINQIMIINMLQKLSYRYSSHYKIIKCVSFESIHYVINLNDVFLFNVFVV